MNIQKVLLKVWRVIRDFVARCIDSSVARESKKASCAALRSNASKNAFVKSSKNASQKACGSCTRRALLSLLVASATLLATFVIAPTSALSAGESAGADTTSTEKVEGAQSGSDKNDGEKQTQSEPNKTESDKKNTGSSSTLTNNNKESKTVEQPNPAGNNGVDNAKSEKFADETAVKKNAKDAQKKGVDSAKANGNGTERSVNEKPKPLEVCKGKYNTFAKCYSITYGSKNKGNKDTINIKGKNGESYNRVPQIITPTIKVAGIEQKTLPNGVWLGLEKYNKDDSVKYAFFKGENDSYTAKSTKNSDGSIRFFASKWLVDNTYRFNVVIHYPDGSKSSTRIKAILAKDDLPKVESGDLTINVNNFGSTDSTAQTGDSDKKSVSITIKPKSNTQGADKKDTYDPINKLFIDSQSKYKPGVIYHHMICKTGSGNNASYTVDSVNGLSLGAQTQFEHKENKDRPKDGTAKDSAVYENDPYTERSQSSITGTPTSAGTFECRVFAFKDAKLKRTLGGGKRTESSNLVKEFDARAETPEGKKSLFEGNIIEDKWKKDSPIQQGVDCDYKSVTIEVKSNNPPKPKPSEIGDNDLTLKVYPFKNDDSSLPAELPDKNNKISAILGMSLKPFVDATSAADSKNKITLRVLCSKGEKKKDNAAGGGASTDGAGLTTGSGSAVSGSNGANSGTSLNGGNTAAGSSSSAQSDSQSEQPPKSTQTAEDTEYKTWSSNLAGLGLSVPADDNQNTCHSDKEGETPCVSADKTKVAARTDKEVTLKPAEVGDYQCVVFALKPDALTKFDGLKGSLTPESISSSLTAAKPTAFKEHKDFAAFTLNIHSVINFTLPHTGGQSWNLQLGILAALLVNLLAAGFVISQSERGRKLILGRWRGLCNHV